MDLAVFIDECAFYEVKIGVAVQPYAESNGDFGKIRNCAFANLKIGILVTNSQSRNMDFQNDVFDIVHTCIQTADYGHGVGNIQGNHANFSINTCYRVLHGSGGWSMPLCISNSYIELGMILGDFIGGTVTFDSCGST